MIALGPLLFAAGVIAWVWAWFRFLRAVCDQRQRPRGRRL